MPPRPRPLPRCVVCEDQAPKYTCASCRAQYCSVACYKTHKETCGPRSTSVEVGVDTRRPTHDSSSSTSTSTSTFEPAPTAPSVPDAPLQDPPALRPLTTLQWPYIPDTSAFPDPLTRDDPKPLQTHQYEAIATSPAIRTLLADPRLRTLLTSIDALRGTEREEALQRALGVDSRLLNNHDDARAVALDEDTRAFRALAEAVEAAVRGGREDVLGLDWD